MGSQQKWRKFEESQFSSYISNYYNTMNSLNNISIQKKTVFSFISLYVKHGHCSMTMTYKLNT